MILTSSFPALAGVLKLCRICGWFRLSISWVILLSLAASAASRFKEERTLWTRSVRGECWEKVAGKSLTFSLRSSTRSSTGAGSHPHRRWGVYLLRLGRGVLWSSSRRPRLLHDRSLGLPSHGNRTDFLFSTVWVVRRSLCVTDENSFES
ncbi:hypothetical protein Salmi_Mp125 (mitochondrion) [Salvia miltiorrhiza]|uniref:Uncharacterized protein n=1 Tax=Salvia miltiorrhiza TaxID=226208 RepID=V9P5E5_SALMI|nr:hypothetical protein Salmi_Mp125 [Salvia miltiorrhiza]AGU16653.1 hypothetical protein Salmi_Mp125 [Salvia miltiorrhiza]